jgi:hypothetical protein
MRKRWEIGEMRAGREVCLARAEEVVKIKRGFIIEYMNKKCLKDGLGWGFVLWLIGYILGFVLFMAVPRALIGWVIMPIGTVITIWVLVKKIEGNTLPYYLKLAIVWTLIAIICDYFFLVRMLKPDDGYYKLDVYIYYTLTFVLPVVVGVRKNSKQ